MRLVLASASPRRAEILAGLGFDVRIHPSDVVEAVLPGEPPEAHAERLSREKALAVLERLHVGPGHGDQETPRRGDEWVLAGDTVVALGAAILGKPRSAAEAVEMLLRLQGRTHRVVSALTLAPSPVADETARGAGAGVGAEGEGAPERRASERRASEKRVPERRAAEKQAPESKGEDPRIFSGIEVTRVTFRAFGRDLAEAYAKTGEPMDKAGAYGIQGLGAALVERIEGDYTGVVGLPVPLLLRLLEDAGHSYNFPPEPAGGRRASSGGSPGSGLTSDRSGR